MSQKEGIDEEYAELYELAPVGYVTVNVQGLIVKANLTAGVMLGVVREALVMAPFARHVAQESLDVYHLHRRELRTNGGVRSCELQMIKGDGSRLWVRVDCSVGMDSGGAQICRAVMSDISGQKVSLDALRESEVRYRRMYQSMMDGFVVVDMEGRLTDWNQEFQEMLGYTDEELGHLTYHNLTPAKWHEMESRLVEQEILHRGYSDLYEKEYVRADGTVFPVELRTSLIRDVDGNPRSMWAIVRDVTARKKDELTLRDWNQNLERRVAERTAELYESKGRFRLLVEASWEGVVISKDGIILDGNPQLGEIYQCDVAGMIGQPISELVAPESRALFASRIAHGDDFTCEFLGLRRDGTRVPVKAHGRMMTWQGIEKWVTAIHDLTAEKAAEAELGTQKAELDQALRLAIISEVSAGIIHQIGQPLCAMGANVATAAAKIKACEVKSCGSQEAIQAAGNDVTKMRELVTHLRALANPEHPNRVPIDFNAMVLEALDLVCSDSGHPRLELKVDLAAGLPQFRGDRVQLSQVVINLVNNARDACAECPPERRAVGIITREIPAQGIELRISDAGTGVAPEALDRLFTPFFSTKSKGFGMGLRLSQTIVEAHGGSIMGDNNSDGVGMTFQVLFPLDSDYSKV